MELLEPEEEGFHEMAFLVQPPIDEPGSVLFDVGGIHEIRSLLAMNSRNSHLP